MPFSSALVWCLEFNNVFRFPINLLHLEVIICVLITLSLTFAKNRFKISTLAAFLKDFLPLQKNEKCNQVPQLLNKNSCQFYAFKNKMDSSQKIANFKLRITLLSFRHWCKNLKIIGGTQLKYSTFLHKYAHVSVLKINYQFSVVFLVLF